MNSWRLLDRLGIARLEEAVGAAHASPTNGTASTSKLVSEARP